MIMKKKLALLSVITTLMANAEVALQGIPVKDHRSEAVKQQMNVPIMTVDADNFTFDDITYWVGEGENQAALVLQWNDERESGALVWGYRFDGEASGYDMIAAIAKTDNRLYYLTHETQYGNTIAGIGFDLDGDGDIALMLGNDEVEINEDGYALTTSYNYDDYTSRDADDLWASGWYTNGYWAYSVSDDQSIPPTTYSGLGASSRMLTDGSADGWNFTSLTSFDALYWKELIAVEAPETELPIPDEFTDGFFIQNEDWYGHAMGSINFIAYDGTPYYNVDNKANGNTEVLGNTSQYGQIYGGYYYVMSKQEPRLVVMDARTLQVVKSFDSIGSGDGRAVLGVDAGKVYVGSSAGIFVLDVDNDFTLSETAIEGTAGTSAYVGQTGMMTRVGKYVFATKQSTGVLIIDPVTDTVVKTIENSDICGVTVSRDGTVWAVAQENIIRINPVTLEYETLELPNRMVTPWGSWMADKMCAAPDENALYYAYGNSTWPNSETSIGKLIINEDGSLSEDTDFEFIMPEATSENRNQLLYGKIDIDPISGYLVATTTQDGYSTNYSYNWLHFIDRETGEVVNTITLTSDSGENYYWFPAMPVFPDNNDPEITLESVNLSSNENSVTFPITDIVNDIDNMPALAVVEAETSNNEIFTVENNGLALTVTPLAQGSADLYMTVNSNGHVIEKTIPVSITIPSGIAGNSLANVYIYPAIVNDILHVNGLTDGFVIVYNMTGVQVASHNLEIGNSIDLGNLASGAYVVKVVSNSMIQTKKIIKL